MRYDVETTQLPMRAVFDLQGRPEDLAAWAAQTLPPWPSAPNTATTAGDSVLAHLGPERWLLWAPLADEARLTAQLSPAEAPAEISLVPVSDSYRFTRIQGPETTDVLSLGCPLDPDPGVFGPSAVSFTDLFGLSGLIARIPGGFDVAVAPSYADMLADYLTRATD